MRIDKARLRRYLKRRRWGRRLWFCVRMVLAVAIYGGILIQIGQGAYFGVVWLFTHPWRDVSRVLLFGLICCVILALIAALISRLEMVQFGHGNAKQARWKTLLLVVLLMLVLTGATILMIGAALSIFEP